MNVISLSVDTVATSSLCHNYDALESLMGSILTDSVCEVNLSRG